MALNYFKRSFKLSTKCRIGLLLCLLAMIGVGKGVNAQTYTSTNCSNIPFSFNETGFSTTETYSWTVTSTSGSVTGQSNGTGSAITQTLVNSSTTIATVTYQVITTSPSSTFELIATVNPLSIITNLGTFPSAICSGNTLLFSANTDISGAVVSWTRNAIAGIGPVSAAGASPLTENLTNNTTDPITVTYNFSINASGCINTQTANIIVNPLPILNNSTPLAICSGTNFSFNPGSATRGASYSWTRNIQSSISNASGSGNGSISEQLTNTSTLPVSVNYNYTVTANGCPNVQTITELVNPTPDIANPAAVTICNGSSFNVSPTNVPVGTTYTWALPTLNPLVSINGGSAVVGSPQASISQQLTNNSPSTASATYSVTPLSGQCIGNPFLVTVNVTNTPVLTVNTTTPICNNSSFVFSPASTNAITSFDWTRAAVSGISTPANNGSGQINEVLTNTGSSPVTVSYIFTLTTLNGCTNTQTISVIVNPTITFNSAAPTSICSNTNFSYIPSSATNNVTFSWTRAAVVGISNTQGSGTGNINETLINTTNTPIIVPYVYTLTSGTCSANQNISVTVNPAPVINDQSITICNNNSFSVNISGAPVGTQYSWPAPLLTPGNSITGTAPSNGLQTGISQTLSNNISNPATATYTITPVAGGCSGQNFTTVVTVRNSPVLSSILINNAICSHSTFIYNPTSTEPGLTTYTWVRASIPGISNTASTGVGPINESLVNLSNSLITVSYLYTIKTAAGCSNTEIVTVAVKPAHSLTSGSPAATCSGNTFIYNPTSASQGATFTWSRPSIVGILNPAANNIVGQINEGLINSTNAAITVQYTYTITASGCTNPQVISEVVNPTPNVTSQNISICNSSPFSINTTGVPIGTKYTWTTPIFLPSGSISGGSAVAVPQNVFTQTLTNATSSPVTATYTVTPIAGSCAGTPFQTVFTVNVNAASALSSNLTPSPICSTNPFNYFPTSSTPGTSFAWSRTALLGVSNPAATGNGNISEILFNTSANPITVTYTISLSSGIGCVGTQNIDVVINPTPVLNNAAVSSICSGSMLNYTPTSATAGSSFSWTRAALAGISNPAASGINNPAETLMNTTPSIVSVTYNYTISANGCTNNQRFDVAVNPTPVLNSGIAPTICSGSNFNYSAGSLTTGTTYVWNRPLQNNISNATITLSSNIISEILVNSSSLPISVRYDFVLTANGCSNNQQVFAIVNPTPAITNQINTICSGTSFSIRPINVPANTNYTWAVPTISPALSITGASAGTAQNNISNTLTNTTNNPATAIYNITPTANGCVGAAFTSTITVTNTPRLNSGLNPAGICSNTVFNYPPTSTSNNVSFGWTRAAVFGISNAGGSGTDNPNEVLINTGNTPITVNYHYNLVTSSGCSNAETVAVVVNPKATLTSANPNPICSGNIFNYTAISSIAGSTFTWSRAVNPSISNLANTGIGDPSEILLNTSVNPISVAYVYAVSAYGCSNTQTIHVLVNPTPTVGNQIATICNNSSFTLSPLNVPAGTSYTWATPIYNPISAIGGGSAVGTPQSSISQALVNTNLNPATATYTITPNSNGCIGANFIATITVSNTVILNSSLAPSPICSNTAFNYTPTSNTAATNFGWTRQAVAGISNPIAAGIGNPNETLLNTTGNSISVSYQFSLSTLAGCTNSQTVSVLVKPSPALISNLNPAAICSGSNFIYTPISNVAGSVFSWTRATVPYISNAPNNGSLSPNEILVNTGITAVTVPYIYTTSVNGCINTQAVNATINPVANIAKQTTTICGNTAFVINPVNIPLGTTYTWQIPTTLPIGSISGISSQNVSQSAISQFLTNQTLNNATVTYTITPNSSGCIGNNFLVDITVKPTAFIANQTIAAICSGTAFSYANLNVPAGTFYTWANPIFGPSGSLTGGSSQPLSQGAVSQILSSTNNLTDTAYYTVSTSSLGCAGSDFVLTVPVKPVPFINNLFDTVCTGSAFSVFPQAVPANTTYTWTNPTSIPFGTVIGGSANNVPVNIISQIPVNTGSSPSKLLYNITPTSNGCTGSSFSLLETVGAQLNPIANSTSTICSGTSFDATPLTTPPNTKYTWTIQSIIPAGMVGGTNAQILPTAKVTGTLTNLSAQSATAIYAVTPSNTGCTGSKFFATIVVRTIPKATITGNPIICAYPLDTLKVNFTGTGPWSFDYLDNGVAKTQAGINTNPYTWIVPTPLLSTSKTLAITRVIDNSCVDSVDTSTYVQKVNPLPIGNIVSMHGNYICNNTIDTLWVNYPASDSLRFQWTYNERIVPGLTTDSIGTLTPGRYNALFTNQYGCTDSAIAPVNLIYLQQPVLKFNYDSYCINKQIIFKNLTDTSFIGATTWLWNMGDSTTRNSFNGAVTYPYSGDRHIRLTATQLYCQSYQTSLDTTINIDFPIAGIRMPSASAYLGQYTPVAARSIPGYRYLWTPSRGIDHPDSSLVNFNYQLTQEYLVQLISKAGCVTNDSVLVRVFDDKLVDIFVPKSFSPNADGNNDKLYPYTIGVKTFQYFKVYNRFGKLMFETRNPDEGWDGTVGGTQQPMAIYIWVSAGIGLDGNLVERKGETLLLR